MNIMQLFVFQIKADLKLVMRDTMLKNLIWFPLFIAILLRLVMPYVATMAEQYGLNIEEYYPLIISLFFIYMASTLLGIITGYLLLDDKDEGTIQAIAVSPLAPTRYLANRLTIPLILGIVLTIIGIYLTNLLPIPFFPLLALMLVCSLLGPIWALFIGAFAKDKVQGFALMKMTGVFGFISLLSYFVEGNIQLLFGIIPLYWSFKAFWEITSGGQWWWIYLLISLIYHLILLRVLAFLFNKKIRDQFI